MNQYADDDFDLGIKQFMIEQAIQQDMEDNIGKGQDNKSYDEKLAEELFKDDGHGGVHDDAGGAGQPEHRLAHGRYPKVVDERDMIVTADIVEDAFTTDAMEEYMTTLGEPASLSTAWRVEDTLKELSYTQMWTLAAEGHVQRVRVYGPDERAAMVQLRDSAPGGARTCKVVMLPDPDLTPHLVKHGVELVAPSYEEERSVQQAFTIQILRFTAPFMFITALFWLLHTWLLDPLPDAFSPRQMLRHRRELMLVASKLSFRSPAKEVRPADAEGGLLEGGC
ncbi:AAA domain-containing protein, partial [Haematococcus lacustris]